MKKNTNLTNMTNAQNNNQNKTNNKKVASSKKYNKQVAQAWGKVAKSNRYRKAVAKELCQWVTSEVIEECLDGMCYNLSETNTMKSDAAQKRLLRRIVEKRQAQSTHRRVGRTDGLFASHLEKSCCSDSMAEINHYRFCA